MKRLLLFATLLAGVVAPPFTIGGLTLPNLPVQVFNGINTVAGTIADDCSACATQVSYSFAPQSEVLSLPDYSQVDMLGLQSELIQIWSGEQCGLTKVVRPNRLRQS